MRIPFFPSSSILEQRWWHRLMRVIIFFWQGFFVTLTCYLAIILISAFIGSIIPVNGSSIEITSPSGIKKIVKKGDLGKAVKNDFPYYKNISDIELENLIIEKGIISVDEYQPNSFVPDNPNNLNNNSVNYLINNVFFKLKEDIFSKKYLQNFIKEDGLRYLGFIPLLLAVSFIPTIGYKIILYIAFGNNPSIKHI